MIAGYVSRPTWIHRTPAGMKLAAVAAVSLLMLPVADWRLSALALGGMLCIYASLGREIFGRLTLLRPLIPLLVVIGLLQGFLDSWPSAAVSITRVLFMVLMASLITLTTTMNDMMAALSPVFAPLQLFGISRRMPALAIALVLRFVPVLLSAWQQREEAWRARTGRRASIRLIPAFIAETLRMADQVAEALDARGYDLSTSHGDKTGTTS